MNNGQHTAKKKRSRGQPNLYIEPLHGWSMTVTKDSWRHNIIAAGEFCLMMNGAQHTTALMP